MSAIRKECIWYGECGCKCPRHCQDFSPADETEVDAAFYFKMLDERGKEYQDVQAQFS